MSIPSLACSISICALLFSTSVCLAIYKPINNSINVIFHYDESIAVSQCEKGGGRGMGLDKNRWFTVADAASLWASSVSQVEVDGPP